MKSHEAYTRLKAIEFHNYNFTENFRKLICSKLNWRRKKIHIYWLYENVNKYIFYWLYENVSHENIRRLYSFKDSKISFLNNNIET